MAPQLVVTGAPSKTWPGGIISLRASDWIGDSAGASIETDARAIEGEVVRETSVYTGSLDTLANRTTALTAMDDTLTIDLSLVDFTAVSQDSHFFGDGDPFPFSYMPYCSVLVEGDWGTQKVGYIHTPLRFDRACMVGIFGDGFYPDPYGNMQLGTFGGGTYLRNCPQYRMQGFGDYIWIETGTEVLHVRAFARDITTIEILIDQIVLVPIFDWGYDYTPVPGGEGSTGLTVPVDGADGGDDNGKFTWHPRNSIYESTGGAEEENGTGGGDYQQDDSEYMVEIVPADEYTSSNLWDDSALPAQHAYSIVGAYHREAEVYETDDFSRTVANAFGTTPKGYFYGNQSSNSFYSVDGSRALTHFAGTAPRDDGVAVWRLAGASSPGMWSSDYIFSGKFEVVQASGLPIWDGITTEVTVIVGLSGSPLQIGHGFAILFDVINEQWRVIALTNAVNPVSTSVMSYTYTAISDWFDVSSWYSVGTEVAFKIELKRFVLRVKLWEASGSEPGAWDHEDFHPLHNGTAWVDYPYSDDELLAAQLQQTLGNVPPAPGTGWNAEVSPFGYYGGNGYIVQWDCYWDDLEFEFDPYGDTANVHALIEHPKGTEVGRIEVPSGAWHFVYWGKKQYATPHDFEFYSTGALDIAMKAWSDAGAAELQRAELPITYFFGILGLDIVSMNWRSAESPHVSHVFGGSG